MILTINLKQRGESIKWDEETAGTVKNKNAEAKLGA